MRTYGFLAFHLKSGNVWFLSHTQPCKCDFPLSCKHSDELNTNTGLLLAIPRLRRSQPREKMNLDALSGVPGLICACASCGQLCSIRFSWDSLQLRPLGARSCCHYLSNASTVLGALTQNRALCVALIWLKNDHVVLWAVFAFQTPAVLVQKELLRSQLLGFSQCMEQDPGLDT